MIRIAIPFVLAVLLIGCTKDPLRNLSQDEARLYITNRDSSTNFSSYNSFRIADSVAVIENDQLVARVREPFDAAMIEAIAAKLVSLGYTRVDEGTNPDLGITVSRIYNDYTGVVSYPNYWGGYGGYYDPWMWGYPGYGYWGPSYIGTYTVTDGAVTVDMFDVKNAPTNNQLRFVWTGLVRGTGTFNTSRVQGHVDALFEQSPYLSNN